MRRTTIVLVAISVLALVAPEAAAQPPCEPWCGDGISTASEQASAAAGSAGVPWLIAAGVLAAGLALGVACWRLDREPP